MKYVTEFINYAKDADRYDHVMMVVRHHLQLISKIRPNTRWTKWMISCKNCMDYPALMRRISELVQSDNTVQNVHISLILISYFCYVLSVFVLFV